MDMKGREKPRITPCNYPTGRTELPLTEMSEGCWDSKAGVEKSLLDMEVQICWPLTCKSEFRGKVWTGGFNPKVILGQMVFKVVQPREMT